MKTNSIVRIVLWSLAIVVLVAILLAGLKFSLPSFHTNWQKPSSGTMNTVTPGSSFTLSPEKVTDITVEWVAGSIRLEPADVDEITVQETGVPGSSYAMQWELRGTKLRIVFSEQTSWSFGTHLDNLINKDLTIQVPQDWSCGTLTMNIASADLEVSGLTIRKVNINSASGETTFHDCAVDMLDLDTASGDIVFQGTLNELDCDAASASFIGNLTNTPSRIDMDAASGDLDLTLPQDCGFSVSIDALSSDFSSEFDTISQSGRYVHGDGRCRIDVDAMSGDVIIRKGK